MKLKLKCILFAMVAILLNGCSQYSEPQGLTEKIVNVPVKTKGTHLDATFESIKTQILEKKCISCHNSESANRKAKVIPLTNEVEVLNGSSASGALVVLGSPNESVLYQSIVKYASIRKNIKIMPPADSTVGEVTAEEQQVVAAWISGFAKPISSDGGTGQSVENCKAEPLIPEPKVLDYAFIKTQILDKKCILCHKIGGKAEEVVFGDNRNEIIKQTDTVSIPIIVVGKAEESSFYLSLLNDEKSRKGNRPMPPARSISKGEVKAVTKQEAEFIKQWINEGAK